MNSNWHRNLSIRSKLLAGFGIIILALAGLWWEADASLRQMKAGAVELELERYPKAAQSNDLIKAALIASQSVRDVAFSNNEAKNRGNLNLNLIRKNRSELQALLIRFDNNQNADERPSSSAGVPCWRCRPTRPAQPLALPAWSPRRWSSARGGSWAR
ncbi:hypothetical protein WG899_19165 [Paucibacter sp. AS339]|uniref:hypothetical protein n=1 Tax=Paucibacter hankyongi TaxID=3133434 RepID=UPI0030B11EE6